ncbi:hypothetical protein FJU08_17540 [Martelella alba]|uniref:Uncharacterized protein n=1 Tax=Martelella alba TaxID=2590451 RepID=A0A506U5F9_9HYPH|nr:hypothetical protein [Martelella alba]TPW28606.1 hypothetical protein FJU08_17540 [Martelella alba]
MTFNRRSKAPSMSSFGFKGRQVDLSGGDVLLGDSVKAVVVMAAGDVSYRPAGETDGALLFSSLMSGAVLPHVPGVIFADGTTATLCTVED